jgi:hypothetical protein
VAEAAEVVSAARGLPPGVAMAGWDAVVQPRVAVAVELDGEAGLPPEVAAARPVAAVPRPGAAAEEQQQAPSARLPAAGRREHPLVLPSTCRVGQVLPSLARRQAARSAHT